MRNRSVTYPGQPVFGALADPTRRAVLDLLCRGELTAGLIAQAFPVSRPAISKHLRLLRRARLIRERREGRRRIYRINAAPLKAVDSWLSRYRAFWEASLIGLKAFVETEQAKERRAPGKVPKKLKKR